MLTMLHPHSLYLLTFIAYLVVRNN